MKLSLTITASAAAIAAVLAALPADAGVSYAVDGDDDGDDSGPLNTAAPAVDASGLPWDERIHSGNKALKADGTWKARKGGPKGAELAAIEGQLRAGQAAAVAAQPIPAPIPQAAPVPAPLPTPAPMAAPVPAPQVAPVAAPAPLPTPAPVPQAAPVPVAAPAPTPMPANPEPAPAPATTAEVADFAGFMAHLGPKMQQLDAQGQPLVSMEYLATVAQRIATAYNITFNAITDLAQQPQYLPYAIQLLQADGRW